jgi:serine phosphatase RsbU (regulator of sigma subunit)
MPFNTFKTIKAKLLFSFGIIFLITCMVIGSNLWFTNKEERLGRIVALLGDIDRNIHIVNKLEKDFFTDEAINPDFYRTGKSEYLYRRERVLNTIYTKIEALRQFPEISQFELLSDLDEVKKDIDEYCKVFNKLHELVLIRGFKDYGLEGKMRESIHAIEESPYPLDKTILLTVRRHEKDFILRKDEDYVRKNILALRELEEDVIKKIKQVEAQKEVRYLINNYKDTFLQLANVEKEMGFDSQSGLKKQLRQISDKLLIQLNLLNHLLIQKTNDVYANINYTFFSTIALYAVVFIIFAFFISQSLSLPISRLSSSINEVIDSNFSKDIKVINIQSKDEIGGLSEDFQYMLTKVHESIEEISKKSEKIEEKQHLLMKSLEYAKQIQSAILPDEEDLSNCFAEYFVLYMPKDVVSGDFYWINRRNDKLFVAMVDCTGHGVPGAFMSMIGHTLLNKIVTQTKIHDPATILEVLHIEVKDALKQENNKNDDGMDIGICLIESDKHNPKHCKVTFAGAKSKLFYTDKGELKEIKGTKRSIGGGRKSEAKPFENHEFVLKGSEIIYLFTDGIIDQQNSWGEKFGKEQLRNLLTNISHLPLKEQYGRILVELNNFMQTQAQRDDISLIGFRI